MKKHVLTFGLISGAISSLMMVGTLPLEDRISSDKGLVIGYTTIVLSLLLVYFGIRSYRDSVGQGQITFARACAVGLLITVISCLCYVVTWEVIYYNFLPDFWDKYGARTIQQLKASGASSAAVQAQLQQIARYKEMYKNPLVNGAMTFIEPFPVGLLMTVVSAAVLRKKAKGTSAEAATMSAQRTA